MDTLLVAVLIIAATLGSLLARGIMFLAGRLLHWIFAPWLERSK